ncbi:MAG: sigma-70 family RNA polymerase sigma factor [Planctomycetes bacterium]|jgi:DNA-directed RNA polymerase specialized sigma24 family protein|nr:sigma-70 family RNA polymerase sigma factor [Planctomycetota bacterium]
MQPPSGPALDSGSGPTPSLTTQWSRIHALSGLEADQAWRWFVGRYRPFVRGVLMTVLDRHSVELAEQDFWGYAFLSGAIPRANVERRFRPFLAGIVRNFARSQARDRGLQLAPGGAIEGLPGRTEQEADLLAWTQNVIANGLRALFAEHEAEGLAMSRFYGLGLDGQTASPLPVSQVAEDLGVSRQAVYMLLHRGRKRLRSLVEQELRDGCTDDEAFRDELQQLLQVAASALPGSLDDQTSTP